MPEMKEQQMDPTTAYTQLDPGQRSSIAQEFIKHFRQFDDRGAQEYARTDAQYVSAAQLAQMHQYAADQHPGILGEVMRHPVITAALGGFAAHELRKYVEHR